MNPQEILTEYANRFSNSKYQPYTGKFFTALDDWRNELPYLHTAEQFCIRLKSAIEKKEKICIYSDYDTDAVTATGVMYWGLIWLGVSRENLSFYAPDRFTEGYGMNEEAAIQLAGEYDLIITVDCGVNSIKEAEHIKKAGKDLIITDHHQITGELPICTAVINPQTFVRYGGVKKFQKYWEKRIGEKTNPGELSFVGKFDDTRFLTPSATGVGVAWFCILWLGYYLRECGQDIDLRKLNKLLPFVAIGTIADCQSIVEPTNRIIVKAGLTIMNNQNYEFPGLLEMVNQTGVADKMNQGYVISSQDLGYLFSPILNSSGRLSHAKLSIESMLAWDQKTAEQKISELIATNNQRKQDVKDILAEVELESKKQFDSGEKILWLQGDWSKGIIGLLASRLVNKYDLPVVVVGVKTEGDSTASLRAPEGYNFPLAFAQSSDLFSKGGGHAQAAGFSAPQENLPLIKKSLQKSLPAQIKNQITDSVSFAPKGLELPEEILKLQNRKEYIWIENQTDLNQKLMNMVWSLDPFGIDFPFPEFVFRVESKNYKWLGEDQKHLKIFLGDGLELVMFNLENDQKVGIVKFLTDEENIDLWVSSKASKNSWNGTTKNDLIVQKIWIIDKDLESNSN